MSQNIQQIDNGFADNAALNCLSPEMKDIFKNVFNGREKFMSEVMDDRHNSIYKTIVDSVQKEMEMSEVQRQTQFINKYIAPPFVHSQPQPQPQPQLQPQPQFQP